MAFSENLKTKRKEKGLSQEQLGEMLGVSRQAISKWEQDDGYPETEKLVQLAEMLGVSLDYLLLEKQSVDDRNSDAPKDKGDSSAGKNIAIRSGDGNKLSAYHEFTIVPVAFSGKNRPKCLLAGQKNGFWDGNAVLGWYATIEEAQRELDEINHAIRCGEPNYQIKYHVNVKGQFNPKIVE